MEQAVSLGNVVDVGGCADDGVYQSRVGVNPNVGHHPKVPLVAFPCLVHLGVALTAAVLGRAGCGNQGGIHHRTGLEHRPLVARVALMVAISWTLRLCFSSKWRILKMVLSSRERMSPGFKRANWQYSEMSCRAYFMAGSLRPNHC